MQLNSLTRIYKKRPTRVGRGGKRGKTSGRGGKGQTARAGNKRRPEMREILKKLPKRRGYGKNRADTVVPRTRTVAVNLDQLEKFENGIRVTPTTLVKAGYVRLVSGKTPPVKILGRGVVGKKFTFKGIAFSTSARAAVEKAGGVIEG